ATAEAYGRNRCRESSSLEDFRCRIQSIWTKIVVERIRPEHHLFRIVCGLPPFLETCSECSIRKSWQISLRCDSRGLLNQAAQSGHPHHPVCGPWSNLCKRGPLIDPSKEISAQRPNAAFPIMRKKFRSVRRDIYIHRAIAFAAFARQTEIKRL